MQEVTQIADHWRRMEGAVVGERYRLLNCLSTTDEDARFAAESEEHGRVTVMISGADEQYEPTGLDHPNLLRVFETGRTEHEGEPFSYVVTEATDESLADVLAERPLTVAETREVLGEVLNALGWLHAHGVAHGDVCPRNIVAVGNTIKLSGATRRFERRRRATPYDPPEGEISPAGDVWSLGTTMFEALTQRLPSEAADLAALPQPFQRVAEYTMVFQPAERWGVDQISGYLSSSSAIDPAPALEASEEKAPPDEGARPGAGRKWGYAALAAAAVAVIAVALWPAGEDGVPPAASTVSRIPTPPARSIPAPPVQTIPEPATARAAAPDKPSPYAPPSQPPPPTDEATREERQVWRVIVYTFSRREDAERRAQSINRRFPQFEAEVYQPNDQAPYLVSIGGRMSREEATQLRATARATGLPRDSYVQNYSH